MAERVKESVDAAKTEVLKTPESTGGLIASVQGAVKGAVDGVNGVVEAANNTVNYVGSTVGAVRAATYNAGNLIENTKITLTGGNNVVFRFHDGREKMMPLDEASKRSFDHEGEIVSKIKKEAEVANNNDFPSEKENAA
jgi:hypothetical protein